MNNSALAAMDKIHMAGVDWTHAGITRREAFAFTEEALAQALDRAKAYLPEGTDCGCFIVSTCNRTEIWAHGDGGADLPAVLCALKGACVEQCRDLFTLRRGEAAIRHLFLTASGLTSQIVGENQILGQMKDALALSRRVKSGGPVLDRLFLAAISQAKRIRTETSIAKARASTAQAAVDCIKLRCGGLAGKKALVIGNGVIGRLCAQLLLREGLGVSMTLRRHKLVESPPVGCSTLNYDDRYSALCDFDVVISATSSPHWTLNLEGVAGVWDGRERLFVDLAVPRDMDPALRNLCGLSLLDLDSLSNAGLAGGVNVESEKIERIVGEEIDRFVRWLDFRPHLATILMMEEALAAGTPVSKLLFGLRDVLDGDALNACFAALGKSLERARGSGAGGDPPPAEGEAREGRKLEGPKGAAPRGATAPVGGGAGGALLSWFPFFLNVSGKLILVAGGGKIALRRVKNLLSFDCRIRLVAPKICPELELLGGLYGERLTFERRAFADGDCAGVDFATAASDSRAVNSRIGCECRERGIFVSVADAQEESTFFFPALIVKETIVAGVSSGGVDHKGASRAAEKIRTALA
ncbi:MAG: glutamyl-tRNA reductase [Spirochaetaceae bacterium]|jgi:glutamyl-tRNA reductase|nr:glutamyl-tRNA reductase [Spirochaetaceae bacterium]